MSRFNRDACSRFSGNRCFLRESEAAAAPMLVTKALSQDVMVLAFVPLFADPRGVAQSPLQSTTFTQHVTLIYSENETSATLFYLCESGAAATLFYLYESGAATLAEKAARRSKMPIIADNLEKIQIYFSTKKTEPSHT